MIFFFTWFICNFSTDYLENKVHSLISKLKIYLMLCNNLDRWDGMGGGKEVKKGGHICIPMADSCQCKAETSTTL